MSTTIMAPSQHVRKNTISNFADLGAGLINDTPNNKIYSFELAKFSSARK